MVFHGDTQKIPESVQITVNAERMLHDQIDRAIREFLVRRNLVEPGASIREFEEAAAQIDAETIERIKSTTRQLSYDLFLQMATDQHQIDKLRDEASRNRLTGLANELTASNTFEKLKDLPEFKTEHHPIAVVRLDLDGFKLINDQAGHPTGNEVLKLVGQNIKDILASLRTTDLAIHFSGDEFGLILTNLKPGTDQDGAELSLSETVESVIARVIGSIEKIQKVQTTDGKEIAVSLSASAGFKIVEYGNLSDFATVDEQAEEASRLSKDCKGIARIKNGRLRIVDADIRPEEFLAEHQISEEEYKESKMAAGLSRPTNDILSSEAKEAGKTVTTEVLKEAEKLRHEYIKALRQLIRSS